MKASGYVAVAVGGVALLALLGWGAKSFLDATWGLPDNHVAATDSRICPQTTGNNVSLPDATAHFDLVVPPSATHLVFTASAGGMQGEMDLSLRFTTTPAGLASFLKAAGLSRPSVTAKMSVGDWIPFGPGEAVQPASGPCGLTPPVNPTIQYTGDGPGSAMEKSPRAVAVDSTTDPDHPVVWVDGVDL